MLKATFVRFKRRHIECFIVRVKCFLENLHYIVIYQSLHKFILRESNVIFCLFCLMFILFYFLAHSFWSTIIFWYGKKAFSKNGSGPGSDRTCNIGFNYTIHIYFRHRPLYNETLSFGSRFRFWNLRKIQLLL